MSDTLIIIAAALGGMGTFLYLTGRGLRKQHEKTQDKT